MERERAIMNDASRRSGEDSGDKAPPVVAPRAARALRSHLRRALVRTVVLTLGGAGLMTALPALSVAAVPDGRVYEQVSPVNKNGNVVGDPVTPETGSFGLATEDGNAVVFVGTGAMGTAVSSTISEFVARRSVSGWATSSAIPRQLGVLNVTEGPPRTVVPSHDFSSFLFAAVRPYVSAEPLEGASSSNIFLSRNPVVEPAWVARPTISNPIPAPGNNTANHNYLIIGGTPDFSSVYFAYAGTLIPQDASRAPYVGAGLGQKTDPWGFYEWRHEALGPAGVLPDGTLNAFGAVPAAIAGGNNFQRVNANPFDQTQTLDNEVSTDGSRAFFLSPDPVASTAAEPEDCAKYGPCTTVPPELYVRESAPAGAAKTVLVSQSQLPGHVGEAAPNGPVRVENAAIEEGEHAGATYVYASPDGSHAFFASTSQLTGVAPSNGLVKEYDFNVNTGTLTYLPGVVGPLVASANDGSGFLFESTASSPALDLWTAGPAGGHVTTITPLPAPPASARQPFLGALDVSGGRVSADGSVFVFRTNSPVPGGFNNAGGFAQIYRYDLATGLSCVSWPPVGVAPSADAHVSYDSAEGAEKPNGSNAEPMTKLDARVMSSDGSRVFFDTSDPLVSQATNGKRDVYEWEGGHVFLISSGKSADNSYVLDSSASGGDVFFTTDEGLVSGDVDNSYDVYDARIPRPGDTPPPSVAPCQGEVCLGPPGLPFLPSAPPSATFNGSGNLSPMQEGNTNSSVKTKTLTRAQRLVRALHACRKKPGKKRRGCEIQARRRFAPRSNKGHSGTRSR